MKRLLQKLALLLAPVIGLLPGMLAALRRGRWTDRAVMALELPLLCAVAGRRVACHVVAG
ncbi:MAG: hypothetical protein ABIQ87_06610 [Rubrivivax sp.]